MLTTSLRTRSLIVDIEHKLSVQPINTYSMACGNLEATEHILNTTNATLTRQNAHVKGVRIGEGEPGDEATDNLQKIVPLEFRGLVLRNTKFVE